MIERPAGRSYEVSSPWNCEWDFTVVFDDAPVGGVGSDLDEL